MVLFLLLGLFTSVIAYSQQISVKGIVKDQIGEPVIGANVLVRGTTNGVITNVNGEFILSASKSDVLVVSFVGYTTQEIPVSEKQIGGWDALKYPVSRVFSLGVKLTY